MSGITNQAEAHEIESTHRIREETRAAVDRYRDEHPARPSASSSGTLASPSDPSDGRFAEAGLIGAASGSGKAATAHMVGHGEGVDVPDKHGLLSPHLKSERKKMLKVFQSHRNKDRLMVDHCGDIHFPGIMDVGLPIPFLGINISPRNKFPSSNSPSRPTR